MTKRCPKCGLEKPFDPSAKPQTKAVGFRGNVCWDCYVIASRAKQRAQRSTPEGLAKAREYSRKRNQALVVDPETGELIKQGAAYKRRKVQDPVTGEVIPASTLDGRKISRNPIRRTQLNTKSRERYAANPDLRNNSRANTRDWYRRHGAWFRFISAQSKMANDKTHPTHKAYCVALVKATPKWLTDAHWVEMNKLYEQIYQTENSVDHVIPIIGRSNYGQHIVCGLNVPWNLQIMCRKANQRKGQALGT